MVNGNVSLINNTSVSMYFSAETLESGGRAGGQKEAFFFMFHVLSSLYNLAYFSLLVEPSAGAVRLHG